MNKKVYEGWLILHGRSKRTIRDRLKILKVLNRSLPDWTQHSVESFLIELKKNGRANTTLNTYINTIRTYAQCMNIPNLQKIGFLKAEATFKATMTDTEIEQFLALPRPKGMSVKTYTAQNLFFSLLAYTGCRTAEIGSLTQKQILSDMIVLTNTKTGKPRNIPLTHLPKSVIELLNTHLANLKTDHLFVTQRGRVYSDDAWGHAFRKRIQRMGIGRKGLTCYSFRHSMATSLLKQDVAIGKIAKLLGNTPEQIYKSYEHLVVEDVVKALNKHPLVRKNANPEIILQDIADYLNTFHSKNITVKLDRSDNELRAFISVA